MWAAALHNHTVFITTIGAALHFHTTRKNTLTRPVTCSRKERGKKEKVEQEGEEEKREGGEEEKDEEAFVISHMFLLVHISSVT